MTGFTSIIAVAGASGDLGGCIVKALVTRAATVLALVRPDLAAEDRMRIEAIGARLAPAAPTDVRALAAACTGAACVVSALSGLRPVMIDPVGAARRSDRGRCAALHPVRFFGGFHPHATRRQSQSRSASRVHGARGSGTTSSYVDP